MPGHSISMSTDGGSRKAERGQGHPSMRQGMKRHRGKWQSSKLNPEQSSEGNVTLPHLLLHLPRRSKGAHRALIPRHSHHPAPSQPSATASLRAGSRSAHPVFSEHRIYSIISGSRKGPALITTACAELRGGSSRAEAPTLRENISLPNTRRVLFTFHREKF